jgi:hypothetical protein
MLRFLRTSWSAFCLDYAVLTTACETQKKKSAESNTTALFPKAASTQLLVLLSL